MFVAERRILNRAQCHFAPSFVHGGTEPRLQLSRVVSSTCVRISPLKTKKQTINSHALVPLSSAASASSALKSNDINDITGNPIFASFPCLLDIHTMKKTQLKSVLTIQCNYVLNDIELRRLVTQYLTHT